MKRTRIEVELEAVTALVRSMEERVPPALKEIARGLSECDGMAHGGDSAQVTTSLGSSTVERAALQLATGRFARSDAIIRAGVKEIVAHVHQVLTEAQRYAPVVEHRRCNRGTGRDDVIVWGNPLCEEYAADDRGGLCLACAKREQRYRRDRGMKARTAA